MTTPTVFISYSHMDESWKDRLVPQLRALETAGLDMQVWHDRKIDGGDKWYPEILAAMGSSTVAILLISPDFLASDFCIKEEVPALIQRQEQHGMMLIPVLVRACPWKAHRWLRERQMIPRDGKCIAIDFAGDLADGVLAQVAEQVLAHLEQGASTLSLSWVSTIDLTATDQKLNPVFEPAVDLTHLPETGSSLFGRDAELELLDKAWAPTDTTAPPIRVLAFTAHGGFGKSTLINHWLAEMKGKQYDGAQRVFGWSFYSQGVRDQSAANSDLFINAALTFFGEAAPTAGTAWDKGQRLAQLVGSQRALLVLDGLEPLQSGHAFERGKLRDPAIESLLRGLARQSLGLCLISTREPLANLAGKPGFHTHDLEQISRQAGRALLRTLRVVGTDAELEGLAHRFGPHALTISLLGVYLREQPGRGVAPAAALEMMPGDTPLERVLAGFEQWLGDSAELDALRMLGLFDRPANSLCLSALRKAPVAPGLTHHLTGLSEVDWHALVKKLAGLLLVHLQPENEEHVSLDAHPLLREYFAKQLQTQNPSAWRAGHKKVYLHLSATAEEGKQPSLEDLQPLYQAVVHGCQAGMLQEAFYVIYRARIQRGNQFYPTRELGAFASDLGAVASFFQRPWVRVAPELSDSAQAWLLNAAAMRLRALGRLDEALAPMRAGLKKRVKQESWEDAARGASNLSELALTLGQIDGDGPDSAVRYATQSVVYADRSGKVFLRWANRATKADALHQAGRRAEALRLFLEAEALQTEHQPEYPFLFSVSGFRYADLLLAEAERHAWCVDWHTGKPLQMGETLRDIEQRVTKTLEWAKTNQSLLGIALDHLSLGRARLYAASLQAVTLSADAPLGTADGSIIKELNAAVDGLRRAGMQDLLPLGLLTRAWLRKLQCHANCADGAQSDLDEAWDIADRGHMPLFLADIHLHRARLFIRDDHYPWNTHADGTQRGPADDLHEARRLIEKHGYWRRKEELQEAEEAMRQWQTNSSALRPTTMHLFAPTQTKDPSAS